jgi:F-type H+-transporting ATPase subunit epsilon
MAREAGILLEVVTPQGTAFTDEVDEVIAPGDAGEFGVLPGHLPMLADLQVGLLHYRQGSKLVDVAIGNGFAEVLRDKVLVLTDRYITRDDVDVLAVRKRLKEVDRDLEKWQGDVDAPERLELIEEEQWLATQLELYGDPPQPKVLAPSRATDYRGVIPDVEGDKEPEKAAGEPHE